MKILIFNWRDIKNPKAGGAEIVTHEYAKRLVKTGYEVTLICSAFSNCQKKEVVDRIKIIRLGFKADFNFLFIHILAFFYYQKHLKNKIDIVIDQIHWVPFFTPLYVKEKKLAFIHETAQNIWQKQFGKVLGFIGKLIEPLFFIPYRSTSFLTVSESTRRNLEKLGISKKNVTVTPNSIGVEPLFKPSKKEKDPTFIFLGRIVPVKNLEDVIIAYKNIKIELPKAKLWIVGRNDDKRYFKKILSLIEKLSLKNDIKFFGFVDEKKKLGLLKKSHIFLHASVTEGWGLVIIEANAMGTPAVVYNVSGLSELVQDKITGLVCSKNTPDELARLAISLIQDRKRYKIMQEKCLNWAKQFSWKESYRKFSQLVKRL